jgi:hypothetical protein
MLTRFGMDVVCAAVPEAVAQAGGLICDRALTGWDVNVFAFSDDTAEDSLALRILGAMRANKLPEDPAEQPLLRAVVVSGSLYRTDTDVRRWVEAAMVDPLIEVLVWDIGRPASELGHVEIPISRAAGAFLAHARTVIECEDPATSSELYCQLRTGRLRRPAPRRQNVLTTVNGV